MQSEWSVESFSRNLSAMWAEFARSNGAGRTSLVLGEIPGDDRAAESAEARRAEAALVQDLGASGLLKSLSHVRGSVGGRNWVLAVGAVGGNSLAGVGVDLEFAQRPVLPGVFERVVQPTERGLGTLEFMDFWVLKEAAFKATPRNSGTVVPSYIVTAWDETTSIAEMTSPRLREQGLQCRALLFRTPTVRVAFATTY